MDSNFSNLQRELHLPSSTNYDPYSPEASIFSDAVPSVKRHAWNCRHFIECDTEEIPIRHTFLENIIVLERHEDCDISLNVVESDGKRRCLQSFDDNLIEEFGEGSLPWSFARLPEHNIMLRFFGGAEKLVLTGVKRYVAVYNQRSNSEERSLLFESDKRPMLVNKWVPINKITLYDAVIAIMSLKHNSDQFIISYEDDLEFVNAPSELFKISKDSCRWDCSNNPDGNIGIPTNQDILVNGDKVYALVLTQDNYPG